MERGGVGPGQGRLENPCAAEPQRTCGHRPDLLPGGAALAGLAGVMVSVMNNLVEPTMGSVPSYKSLAIIVLGGLGSVRGTLLASLVLGVIEAFGTIYLGKVLDRNAIAFAFLILVLMVRPRGLFAGK